LARLRRSDRFYIREYEEETNLRATILLDLSGSMNYGRSGADEISLCDAAGGLSIVSNDWAAG
jgi:uncharacterized protein (DUF58 family)